MKILGDLKAEGRKKNGQPEKTADILYLLNHLIVLREFKRH